MNTLINSLKSRFYFVGAKYFAFFAKSVLDKWSPSVIVVTGSSGKTTLLNMLDAQFGDKAKVSHNANSAYGIPFDILGLQGVGGSRARWIVNFALAPIKALTKTYATEFYIAEVDAERPGEAPILAGLLKPDVTLWVSSAKTHARFFDKSVESGKFDSIDKAVAHEYGEVARATADLVMFDASNSNIVDQMESVSCKKIPITPQTHLKSYKITKMGTEYQLKDAANYKVKSLQPKVVANQIAMLDEVLKVFKISPDYNMQNFRVPPGRSRLFEGVKKTTLIDSTYNANLSSMLAISKMFKDLDANKKWFVAGDMVELGKTEVQQHIELARVLADVDAQRYILMGPRINKYTKAELQKLVKNKAQIIGFEGPREVLDYLQEEISGGETILFKGARFLEGVIEHLLADKADTKKLPRRSAMWQKRREKWGL